MNRFVVGAFGARTALILAVPVALAAAGSVAAAAPAVAATGGAAAPSCTIRWVGKGAQPVWTDPQNWSTGKLPGRTDDVCITATDDDVLTTISIKVNSILIGNSQGIDLHGSTAKPVTATIATSIGTAGGISRIDMTDATIKAAQVNLHGTTIFTTGNCNLASPDVNFSNADLQAFDGTTTVTGLPQLRNGTLTGVRVAAANSTIVLPGDISHLVSSRVTAGQGSAIDDPAGQNALTGLTSVDAQSELTDDNSLTLTGSSFTANGNVTFGGGNVAIAGPYTQAGNSLLLGGGTLSASPVTISQGARVFDGGAITGNVVNAGLLKANGTTATISGDYTQGGAAILVSGFSSLLAVTGTATLAGSVSSQELLARTGDSSPVITFGSLSGGFTNHILGLRLVTKPDEIDAIELPQIVTSPRTVAAGQPVTVTGGGFTFTVSVRIFLDHTNGTPLDTVSVDPTGGLSTTVAIPAGTAAGTHRLIAVASDGNQASTTITTK